MATLKCVQSHPAYAYWPGDEMDETHIDPRHVEAGFFAPVAAPEIPTKPKGRTPEDKAPKGHTR